MVKIIEKGLRVMYSPIRKVTVTTLYSHMVDEEDLILIGGCNSYQVIIDNASMYSRHIKQALRGLDGDKVVILSKWSIGKRFRD